MSNVIKTNDQHLTFTGSAIRAEDVSCSADTLVAAWRVTALTIVTQQAVNCTLIDIYRDKVKILYMKTKRQRKFSFLKNISIP